VGFEPEPPGNIFIPTKTVGNTQINKTTSYLQSWNKTRLPSNTTFVIGTLNGGLITSLSDYVYYGSLTSTSYGIVANKVKYNCDITYMDTSGVTLTQKSPCNIVIQGTPTAFFNVTGITFSPKTSSVKVQNIIQQPMSRPTPSPIPRPMPMPAMRTNLTSNKVQNSTKVNNSKKPYGLWMGKK
jgi:hypothetical protein